MGIIKCHYTFEIKDCIYNFAALIIYFLILNGKKISINFRENLVSAVADIRILTTFRSNHSFN